MAKKTIADLEDLMVHMSASLTASQPKFILHKSVHQEFGWRHWEKLIDFKKCYGILGMGGRERL
jgi:hypothetical protein